jgi:hypothetical protein
MSLSYLVSTAGHAQYQNEVYPHNISSLTQLIREGAEELGDRHVVGFAEPLTDDNGKDLKDSGGRLLWQCYRLCEHQLLQHKYLSSGADEQHYTSQLSRTYSVCRRRIPLS